MKSNPTGWRPSYGKGGGKGKGKGKKGKGYGRKGFGKFKGKGKSKGFGKRGPKGFGKLSWYNEKRGLGDFSEGIPDSSSVIKQHHVTTQSTTTAQHHTIYSSSDEELLAATRTNASAVNVETTASSTMPAVAVAEKKLSFVALFHEIFFTVRGERRRGLIVDPGAASGLVGTETLRDIIESCVTPAGKNDEMKNSFEVQL